MAFALRCEGRYADATREFREAISTLQKAYGQSALEVLRARHGLGETLAIHGDFDGAWNTLEESSELVEESVGPSHPLLAAHLLSLGLVLVNQLRLTEARISLERALRIVEDAEGGSYPVLTVYLNALGKVALEMGQPERAIPYYRRSLALLDESDAHRMYNRMYPLGGLGEAHLGLGKTSEAIEFLERALQSEGNAEAELDFAHARFILAKASWYRSAPRARTLADEALTAYRKLATSPLDVRDRQHIEQWLAQHRK